MGRGRPRRRPGAAPDAGGTHPARATPPGGSRPGRGADRAAAPARTPSRPLAEHSSPPAAGAPPVGRGQAPSRTAGSRVRLGRVRLAWGWGVGVLGPCLLAWVASGLDVGAGLGVGPGLANSVPLFLTLTVAAALLGGLLPALASATAGSLLLVWCFTPPTRTWTVADPGNAVAIAVFFAVAASVASVVDLAARRTHQAERLRAESETLSFLAGSVLRGDTTLDGLLRGVRETFAVESAALLERPDDRAPWTCAAHTGPGRPPARPEDADVDMPVGDRLALALTGRIPPAEDRRVLGAFAAQAAVFLDRQRLVGQAEEARRLAEGDKIRTALLAAVSHDLRTPLAAIKAAVSSLRSDDVEWSDEDRAGLLEGIEEGADRLDHLIGNLLDMSRLRTGTVTPLLRVTDLDEVVPMALGGVPEGSVELDVPESLPMVTVDRGLLERAVANLVENAVKYTPAGSRVLVSARARGDRVELRVTDRGPGVPDEAKERVFAPFQRHGDSPRGTGVGLGLAVARGFAEAMHGTLTAEDTPGGGLTMVLALRSAQARAAEADPGPAGSRPPRKAGPP